jgi:hypothetical protein
MYHQ